MNTNQEISTNNQSQSVSATSILNNFLNKKAVMNDEQIADVEPQISESGSKKSSPAAEILSRLQSKKETAAVNLGISAAEVETMPFDLSQLETEGIFLNVDCQRFQHFGKTNRMEIARRGTAACRRDSSKSAASRTTA